MAPPTPVSARAWSFDELVREGVSLIPAYAPAWTNHNPSDPGITLIELLAYYSEILAYRALRVTPDAKLHFLRLLDGAPTPQTDALRGQPASAVDEAIAARVRAMSRVESAATCRDFERLAVEAAAAHLGADKLVRALCVEGVDLRRSPQSRGLAADQDALADVSVVLAPEHALPEEEQQALCQEVQRALAPRCLITTRVHVVGPVHLHVFVGCRMALQPGASLQRVVEAIDDALRRRFGPVLADESLADARPFGRPLHVSEVAEVIDRTEGVDYVEGITVQRIGTRSHDDDDPDSLTGLRIGRVARPGEDARLGGRVSIGMRRLRLDDAGEVESIAVHPWETVRVRLVRDSVIDLDGSGDADPAAHRVGERHAS